MKRLLYKDLSVRDNHLCINNVDTEFLKEKYGTPLYILDEDRVRENCRMFANAMKYFKEGSSTVYASKALCVKYLYKVIENEYLGFDVSSVGEIYTLLKAGCSLKNAYFHGNNKTDSDIQFALDYNIGYFVIDNIEEALAINRYAHKKQDVLIRITPGIDPHTFEAVATGKVDSKFGTSVLTGQAIEIVREILKLENLNVIGIHSHVGSLIFDDEVFIKNTEACLDFIRKVKDELNYQINELDLAGGFPVRYTASDPKVDIDFCLKSIADKVREYSSEIGIEEPIVHFEPGRSIVADAGYTLYNVGSVKRIRGYKNYVSVDGGMSDNPRYALYRSAYTVCLSNKMNEENDLKADVVGRCCESGDIIQPNVKLPKSVERNDTICVLTTGAYNYSMASNYNSICKPAMVAIKEGRDILIVEREHLDDLIKNHR